MGWRATCVVVPGYHNIVKAVLDAADKSREVNA